MKHLVVHLPYEAFIRGPVHNGWMYPYERSMKHLKGKAGNLAKVECSIVVGSLTADTSNFTSYYFAPTVRTRKEFLEEMIMEEYRHHMQLMVFLTFSVKLDGLVVN